MGGNYWIMKSEQLDIREKNYNESTKRLNKTVERIKNVFDSEIVKGNQLQTYKSCKLSSGKRKP